MNCPNCNSNKIQAIIESKLSNHGYSTGNGCLGFLLLGPLGLLFGLNSKTNISNQTIWLCQNCGNKFENPNEVLSRMRTKYKNKSLHIFIWSFITLFLIYLCYNDNPEHRIGHIILISVMLIIILCNVTGRIIAKKKYDEFYKQVNNDDF